MTINLLDQSYLQDTINNQEEVLKKNARTIAQGFIDKQFTLLEIAEAAGFILVSDSIATRAKGVKLFALIISFIPSTALTAPELHFVAQFFQDRLKDHHSVLPAIFFGVETLLRKNIPGNDIRNLIVSIFQHTTCQSQSKEDRSRIYTIFHLITEKFPKEFRKAGPDFVYIVMNAIDGERDPHNLDQVFTMIPKFIRTFDLHHLVEEMFETFACYFPIDFNPNNKDKNAVTRDELAEKLGKCLVATDDFCDFLIELILEKIESDFVAAKIDCLLLMSEAVEAFSLNIVSKHLEKLWIHLKRYLFPGDNNKDITEKSINAIRSMVKSALADYDTANILRVQILSDIIPFLNEPNHRMFDPACAVAFACTGIDSNYTEKVIFAFLCKLEEVGCDPLEQQKIIDAMTTVFTLCANLKFSDDSILERTHAFLSNIFLSNTNNDTLKATIECLTPLIPTLDCSTRNMLYNRIAQIFSTELDLKILLKELALFYKTEVKEEFLPLMRRRFNTLSLKEKEGAYNNFIILVEQTEFVDEILNFLIGNLTKSESILELELHLKAIHLVFGLQLSGESLNLLYRKYKLIEILIGLKDNEISHNMLKELSHVLSLALSKFTDSDQDVIFITYFSNLQLNSIADIYIGKGILNGIKSSEKIDKFFQNIMEQLLSLLIRFDNTLTIEETCKLLCIVLNRATINNANNALLNEFIFQIENLENHFVRIQVIAWMVKGLIVRGHTAVELLLDQVFKALDTQASEGLAAFKIITANYPDVCLPIVKAFFQQRLLHLVMNRVQKLDTEPSESYICALIYTLQQTPYIVIKMNLAKIGNLIFKSFQSSCEDIVRMSLEIILKFIELRNEYMQSNVGHILQLCIQLSRTRSMKTRVLAIQCIEAVSKYPSYITIQHKSDTIIGLSAALDDKKRIVRNSAVRARNAWFLIDASVAS